MTSLALPVLMGLLSSRVMAQYSYQRPHGHAPFRVLATPNDAAQTNSNGFNMNQAQPMCYFQLGPLYCPYKKDIPFTEWYASSSERMHSTLMNGMRMDPKGFKALYASADYNYGLSDIVENLAPFYYETNLQQAAKQMSYFGTLPNCTKATPHDTCESQCYLYGGCYPSTRITYYTGPNWLMVSENLVGMGGGPYPNPCKW